MDEKPTAAGPSAKPRRRWYQYSLRTLLIVVTLAGCVCWLGVKMREARQQQANVELIEREGCFVIYDYQIDSLGGQSLWKKLPGPEWLHSLLGADFFRAVHSVDFVHAHLVEADMEHLTRFSTLKVLRLFGTDVTDADLAYLQRVTQLESLDLSSTKITDTGLKTLTGLTQLSELNLWNTQVTAGGARRLRQALPNCKISH